MNEKLNDLLDAKQRIIDGMDEYETEYDYETAIALQELDDKIAQEIQNSN